MFGESSSHLWYGTNIVLQGSMFRRAANSVSTELLPHYRRCLQQSPTVTDCVAPARLQERLSHLHQTPTMDPSISTLKYLSPAQLAERLRAVTANDPDALAVVDVRDDGTSLISITCSLARSYRWAYTQLVTCAVTDARRCNAGPGAAASNEKGGRLSLHALARARTKGGGAVPKTKRCR